MEAMEKSLDFLDAIPASEESKWVAAPNQAIGLNMTLHQSGTTVSGAGQLWNANDPGKKTAFTVPSGTINDKAVQLSILIGGAKGSYSGTFDGLDKVKGTVVLGSFSLPLIVDRIS